jgi:ubiquinone/menaquinone biosynthesis C-methylase UbiE
MADELHGIPAAWLGRYDRALDFGCAEGSLTAIIAKHSGKTYGVDISAKDIRRAKRAHKKISFERVSPGRRLPFPGKYFDAAFAMEVLEHTGGKENAVLSELNRVLRDGGKLFITVPHKGFLWQLDPLNYRAYFPIISGIYPNRGNVTGGFHKHYSKKELQAMLKAAGFETGKVRYSRLSPFDPLLIILWSLSQRTSLLLPVYRLLRRLLSPITRVDWGEASYGIAVCARKLAKKSPRPKNRPIIR